VEIGRGPRTLAAKVRDKLVGVRVRRNDSKGTNQRGGTTTNSGKEPVGKGERPDIPNQIKR